MYMYVYICIYIKTKEIDIHAYICIGKYINIYIASTVALEQSIAAGEVRYIYIYIYIYSYSYMSIYLSMYIYIISMREILDGDVHASTVALKQSIAAGEVHTHPCIYVYVYMCV